MDIRLVGRNDREKKDLYLSVVDDLRSWALDLSLIPGHFVV